MFKQYVVVALNVVLPGESHSMSVGQIAAQIAHASTAAAEEFGTRTEGVATIVLAVEASAFFKPIESLLASQNVRTFVYKDDGARWTGLRATALVTQVMDRETVIPIFDVLPRYSG